MYTGTPDLPWTLGDANEQPGKKKPNCIHRECPVPGCNAYDIKLSQHLKQTCKLGGEQSIFSIEAQGQVCSSASFSLTL